MILNYISLYHVDRDKIITIIIAHMYNIKYLLLGSAR